MTRNNLSIISLVPKLGKLHLMKMDCRENRKIIKAEKVVKLSIHGTSSNFSKVFFLIEVLNVQNVLRNGQFSKKWLISRNQQEESQNRHF